jgi:hypothetical protein
MVPQVAVHVAGALAVNCCVEPSVKVGLEGLMVREGAAPMVSTTLAV